MFNRLLFYATGASILTTSVYAQYSNRTSPLTPKFKELVNDTLHLWNVPGIAIAVVDGNNSWAEGYGIATYPNTPVTADTLFYAGSTTKAFTAACFSLLINSGNFTGLAWDTPLSEIIREDFVLENNWATNHITVEDALSHRSGMPRHEHSYGGLYNGRNGTLKDVVQSLRYLPLAAQPRTTWIYSNVMYITVSHAIETLSGMWLGDFLKETIWGPLGMNSTYFSTPDAEAAPQHLAQGYNCFQGPCIPVPNMDLTIVSGAGSTISNVLDYAKWVRAWLTTSAPLSPTDYTDLKSSRIHMQIEDEPGPWSPALSYTLGWETGTYQGHEFWTHAGGLEAFGTQVIFIPDIQFGVVAMGNTALPANYAEWTLLWHLVDEKINLAENDRFDWNKMQKDILTAGLQAYNDSKALLYPSKPDPPLPTTLPIESYTGTYFNPGYRNLTITLKDGKLNALHPDYAWKASFDFEHVSGDYFMVYTDLTQSPKSVFRSAGKGEFIVGEDGKPKSVGMGIEPSLGPEGKIWFERV